MVQRTPAIMILGTGSNVGKSLIVAGLCRCPHPVRGDVGKAGRSGGTDDNSNLGFAGHGHLKWSETAAREL